MEYSNKIIQNNQVKETIGQLDRCVSFSFSLGTSYFPSMIVWMLDYGD